MIDQTGDVAAQAARLPFYFVGPTATGKSAIAVEVARACEAEIVSADAFQIYRGFDLLSAKPTSDELAKVPHHLISAVPATEEMNAEKFRELAQAAIDQIHARGRRAFVVGGSGMYVKALREGLSPLPKANEDLRGRLNEYSEGELLVRLNRLDPETSRTIDAKNKRRLIRALEICLLSGRPASAQRQRTDGAKAHGVFLFRDRDDLYARINARVEMMFAQAVVEEIRAMENVSSTAAQILGLGQIRELIAGRISEAGCVAAIQQATRRYAKRQLTWFRRQTNFSPLNLTHHGSAEVIASIAQKVRFALTDV